MIAFFKMIIQSFTVSSAKEIDLLPAPDPGRETTIWPCRTFSVVKLVMCTCIDSVIIVL